MQSFVISSHLSPHMSKLADGSLLVRSTPLARTGWQEYTPAEIGVEGPAEKRIRVWRDPTEVLSKRTRASLESATLTNDHPPHFVSPTSWKAWASGHVRNIQEGEPTPDGEKTLTGDLVVNDRELAEAILSGRKRELSVGYDCEYSQDARGRWEQRNIIANHVAVVQRGRAGENIRILDHALTGEKTMGTSKDATLAELLGEIRKIAAPFQTTTQDQDAMAEMSAACSPSPEAIQFARAARQFHRSVISASDCRPSLREEAEARRAGDSPEDDAADYAAQMRQHHRR